MGNVITWFEIFVTDLDRATRFYQTMLAVDLRREAFNGTTPMAIFPYGQEKVGGALVLDPKRRASEQGTLVYLSVNGKLDATIDRVAAAGGAVVLPKTDIGMPGFIATVRDSEGNLVGLHSER